MSPGVRMSWSEMCTWNEETPAIVPAGARISAGKFGIVARSLPKAALTLGEAVSGELHAVAGVAGEADHDLVERLGRRAQSSRRSPLPVSVRLARGRAGFAVGAPTSSGAVRPAPGRRHIVEAGARRLRERALSHAAPRARPRRDATPSRPLAGRPGRRASASTSALAAEPRGLEETPAHRADHDEFLAGIDTLEPGGRFPDRDRHRRGAPPGRACATRATRGARPDSRTRTSGGVRAHAAEDGEVDGGGFGS